jgi:hypothetical protein
VLGEENLGRIPALGATLVLMSAWRHILRCSSVDGSWLNEAGLRLGYKQRAFNQNPLGQALRRH